MGAGQRQRAAPAAARRSALAGSETRIRVAVEEAPGRDRDRGFPDDQEGRTEAAALDVRRGARRIVGAPRALAMERWVARRSAEPRPGAHVSDRPAKMHQGGRNGSGFGSDGEASAGDGQLAGDRAGDRAPPGRARGARRHQLPAGRGRRRADAGGGAGARGAGAGRAGRRDPAGGDRRDVRASQGGVRGPGHLRQQRAGRPAGLHGAAAGLHAGAVGGGPRGPGAGPSSSGRARRRGS